MCTLEAVLRAAIWSFNGPCHCLGGVGAVDGATQTPPCARDPGWQAPTPTADRNLPCSGAWSFSYLILNPTSTPTSVRLTRYHYSDFHHARPTAPRTLRRPTPDRRYAPPKLPNTLRSRRSAPRRRDLNTCHPRLSPLHLKVESSSRPLFTVTPLHGRALASSPSRPPTGASPQPLPHVGTLHRTPFLQHHPPARFVSHPACHDSKGRLSTIKPPPPPIHLHGPTTSSGIIFAQSCADTSDGIESFTPPIAGCYPQRWRKPQRQQSDGHQFSDQDRRGPGLSPAKHYQGG